MLASELVSQLNALIATYGDVEVMDSGDMGVDRVERVNDSSGKICAIEITFLDDPYYCDEDAEEEE